MSDFLARMIERASGRSPARLPLPPPQYQWQASLDRPLSVSPGLPSSEATQRNSLSPHGSHSLSSSSVGLDWTLTAPQLSGDSTVLTADPNRSSNFAASTPDAPLATTADKDVPLQSPELAQVDFAVATRPRPPVTALEVHDPATLDGSSVRVLLREPNWVTEAGKTAIASPSIAELPPNAQSHMRDQRSPAPGLIRSTRAEGVKGAKANPEPQAAEPIVEVKIERVDVRLDAPKQPVPQPSSRPRGFAEYESLRRYVASPWFRRR